MKRLSSGLAFVAALAGCAAMPDTEQVATKTYNVQSEGRSELDGSRYIRVSNIVCGDRIVLSLYQEAESAATGHVLVAAGVNSIENIGGGEALKIRADGSRWSYSPVTHVTRRGEIAFGDATSVPISTKRFRVPESEIRRMAAAGELVVRVSLIGGIYAEGACHDKPATVSLTDRQRELADAISPMTGLQEFVRMMNEADW